MYIKTYVPVTMLILRAQYSKGGQAVNGGGLLSQVEEITFTATHLRTLHTLHFKGSGASLSNEGSRGVARCREWQPLRAQWRRCRAAGEARRICVAAAWLVTSATLLLLLELI